MRMMTLWLTVLTSCASAAALANRPAHIASSLPCLDGQGQRELVAGCELEIGEERAKRREAETKAAEAQARVMSAGIGGGTLGVVLTALVVLIVEGYRGR